MIPINRNHTVIKLRSTHLHLDYIDVVIVFLLLCKEVSGTEYFHKITGWTHLPPTIKVWPLPQKISHSVDNLTLSLYSELVIHTTSESPILSEGVQRYHSILQFVSKKHTESKCGNSTVRMIQINVDGDDENLSLNTSYKYSVTVDVATGIVIHAENPFGAL